MTTNIKPYYDPLSHFLCLLSNCKFPAYSACSFVTTDINPYYDSFIRWQFWALYKQARCNIGLL